MGVRKENAIKARLAARTRLCMREGWGTVTSAKNSSYCDGGSTQVVKGSLTAAGAI
jgi:hypothetical protein